MITRRPLSPLMGFEILNLDLTKPIDEETRAALRSAWSLGGILLVRAEGMTEDMHLELSRAFGELEISATKGMNDTRNPYLLSIEHDPENPRHLGRQHYRTQGLTRAGWIGWHWDQAFMPEIVRGAALRMVEPASEMGETGFVDGIAAYDRLSPAMKEKIENLEVVYKFDYFGTEQFGFPDDLEAIPGTTDWVPAGFPPVVHPLVVTHPEIGRKVLKLSPMHSQYILGWEKESSDSLLQELAEHLVDPAYAYFHPWKRDDIIIWDNWRVIHSAVGIPLHCKRRAVRTTIVGDYKVGRLLDPNTESAGLPKFLD